jgi:DNA polymerase-3 subunit gamma/tau
MIHGIHLQDSKKVLNLLNEIIGQGKDLKRFLNQMIEYMRYMMLSKVSEDLSTLIAMPEEKILYFKEQSSALSLVMIMRSIDILTQIEIDTKWSSNSRVILEIGLIKIMQPDLEKSIESLTHRVEMLEQNKALVSATPIIRNTEKKAEEKIEKPSKTLSDPIVEKPYADPLKGDLDSYEDLWEDVLEEVKAVKIATHALLIDGKFKGVIDGALCVAYGDGYGFHMIAIEKVENKKIVETAIEKVYKEPYPIKYITEVDEISTKDPNNHDDLYDFLGNHKNKLEFEE